MQAAGTLVPRAAARVRRVDLRVVIGVLLMLLAVGGSASVIGKAQARIPILVAARSVEPGQAISGSDLRVAELAVSEGVEYIPASSRGQMVGQIAAEPLWPGKVLGPRAFAKSFPLPGGFVGMSVALKPDRAVAGALRSGDRVAVIASVSPDRPDGKTTILFTDVPVLSVREAQTSEGSGVIVVLRLRLEEARALAQARSAGSVDLVLLPGGQA